MPIFAHGDTKDKLTILHYAYCASMDLMREQLYRAMVENDCMSYFAFETSMNEMEEDGLIAAIPRAFGQAYRITVRGEETLRLFAESLPFSLRERLRTYLDANRDALRLETQLQTSMEELYGGAYMVHFKAVERNSIVLDISMKVASRSMAQRMRRNWESASEEIYSDLFRRLLPPEQESEEAERPEDGDASEMQRNAEPQAAEPAASKAAQPAEAGSGAEADSSDNSGSNTQND